MAYRLNPFTGELDLIGTASSFGGVDEIVTDSGSAFPVAGVINILGVNGISTSGDGAQTVTIALNPTVTSFTPTIQSSGGGEALTLIGTGKYIQQGRVVVFQAQVQVPSVSGGSGDLILDMNELPTPNDIIATGPYYFTVGMLNYTGAVNGNLFINPTSGFLLLSVLELANGGGTFAPWSGVTNGTRFFMTGSYIAKFLS